jgi:hypothetical protein
MVDKYSQLSAQQKISPDEATCLQDEKNARNGFETRWQDKLTEAMERGTGTCAKGASFGVLQSPDSDESGPRQSPRPHTRFTSEIHRRRRNHHSGVNNAQSATNL